MTGGSAASGARGPEEKATYVRHATAAVLSHRAAALACNRVTGGGVSASRLAFYASLQCV